MTESNRKNWAPSISFSGFMLVLSGITAFLIWYLYNNNKNKSTKSTSPSSNVPKPVPENTAGVTQGGNTVAATVLPSSKYSSPMINYDIPGNDIVCYGKDKDPQISQKSCEDKCTETPNCKSYNYLASGNTYWKGVEGCCLKNTKDLAQIKPNFPGITLYLKNT